MKSIDVFSQADICEMGSLHRTIETVVSICKEKPISGKHNAKKTGNHRMVLMILVSFLARIGCIADSATQPIPLSCSVIRKTRRHAIHRRPFGQ